MTQAEAFFKNELVKELRNVARLFKHEKDIQKKSYYFSAAYGITSRTFRYSFSRQVLLSDLVLNVSYHGLKDRLERMEKGDTTVKIDEKVLEALYEGLITLADAFESDNPVQDALGLILAASYSIGGPGNYLREKGLLTL